MLKNCNLFSINLAIDDCKKNEMKSSVNWIEINFYYHSNCF